MLHTQYKRVEAVYISSTGNYHYSDCSDTHCCFFLRRALRSNFNDQKSQNNYFFIM